MNRTCIASLQHLSKYPNYKLSKSRHLLRKWSQAGTSRIEDRARNSILQNNSYKHHQAQKTVQRCMSYRLKIQKSSKCLKGTAGKQTGQHLGLNKYQGCKPHIERQKPQKNIQARIACKLMQPSMKMFQMGTFGSFAP